MAYRSVAMGWCPSSWYLLFLALVIGSCLADSDKTTPAPAAHGPEDQVAHLAIFNRHNKKGEEEGDEAVSTDGPTPLTTTLGDESEEEGRRRRHFWRRRRDQEDEGGSTDPPRDGEYVDDEGRHRRTRRKQAQLNADARGE